MTLIRLVKILFVISAAIVTVTLGIENPKSREKRAYRSPSIVRVPVRTTTQAPKAIISSTTTATTTTGTVTLTIDPSFKPVFCTDKARRMVVEHIRADKVALSSINTIRIAHQAPPVTYSAMLRTQAQQCVTSQVQNPDPDTNQCNPGNQGMTWGASDYRVASRRIREIVSSTTTGWQAAYLGKPGTINPCTYWSSPAFVANAADYTQMIWMNTTQVGCAYSAEPAGSGIYQNQYFFICIWSPAGNDPKTFSQNVRQDTQ